MSEVERLRAYHPFDEDVLQQVSEVAERQRKVSWQTIASGLPEKQVFRPEKSKAIEVLDIKPSDYESTQVYYLPMGNSLDPSMSLRVATLAAVQPSTRVIAVSNPGAPGHNKGRINIQNAHAVAKDRNLRPLVELTFRYLGKLGIDETTQVGYSFGADKAAIACRYARWFGHSTKQGIFMEPAGIKNRGLMELAHDFNNTADSLDDYVFSTHSTAYQVARHYAEKQGYGLLGYALGLARISNLAVAKALTKDKFWSNVGLALVLQKDMAANIVWGTASELSDHDIMSKETYALMSKYGAKRVHTMMLDGHKHAMGDDIFLHAAMVLQSTKQVAPL